MTGDTIILVNPIANLTQIGAQFVVTKIDEDGVIFFETGFGSGCMNFKEFNEHFEIYKEAALAQKQPSQWTPWELDDDGYYYRTNGAKVQIRVWHESGPTGSASCHPSDKFNLDYGRKLAIKRLELKEVKAELDALLRAA